MNRAASVVTALDVENYRSLRKLRLRLSPLTLVIGPNGCGKTNCYRALRLLSAAASGTLAATMGEEGGMPSALWAGRRQKGEVVRMKVRIVWGRFIYSLALGLPTPKRTRFMLDPEVKEEEIAVRLDGGGTTSLCQRSGLGAKLRDEAGRWQALEEPLDTNESILAQLHDPARWPELALLRGGMSRWRHYHEFRTDADAPLRHPRLGVRTNALAHDGCDLAAALQTIGESDREPELATAIASAFPGATLEIPADQHGRLWVEWGMPGVFRRFQARELSDGTLRFLCLAAACLSPKPPPLIALNEPETSLHPDLVPALAELIAAAASRGQVVVTTHSQELARRLEGRAGILPLVQRKGETRIAGHEDAVMMTEEDGEGEAGRLKTED